MSYEKLHKNSIKSWMIARIITTIIVLGPMLFIRLVIFKDNFDKDSTAIFKIINIAILIIALLMVLNVFVYPFFEYKQWRYIITKDKIEFSEGIYFIKKVTIPIIRVQHIQVTQGVINRWFKLADVQISTAGGVHKIPNIELEKAEAISEYLKDKIKEKVEANV